MGPKLQPRNTPTLIALMAGAVITTAFAHGSDTQVLHTNWQVQRYTDPMHKAGVVASTSQSSAVEDNDFPKITVVVRCWSATQEIDVRFMTDDDRRFTSDDVKWQVDRNAPRSARWRTSPRGNAIVVPERMRRDMLRGMRKGKELILQVQLSEDRRYRISLAGSSVSIGEVESGCQK